MNENNIYEDMFPEIDAMEIQSSNNIKEQKVVDSFILQEPRLSHTEQKKVKHDQMVLGALEVAAGVGL